MEKTVAELFAGVGGFRVGLNNVKEINNHGRAIESNNFKFVFANQWEPSTKIQHAFDCYVKRFGESNSHSNEDISIVDKQSIPNHSLLVGGFPCQDYSVARSLSKEKGIQGKKGVLWWQIRDTLEAKRPPFVLLENVDRLLKSPSKQRGRDFGIMLRTLADLGYGVEWRVINAADYGHVQRRRRVFIFGFHQSTKYYNNLNKLMLENIIKSEGLFAKTFPIKEHLEKNKSDDLNDKAIRDLVFMSDTYKFTFENSGVMIDYKVLSAKSTPLEINLMPLRTIIQTQEIPLSCYLNGQDEKFIHLKGSKKLERTNKETGHVYYYSEGSMSYPDSLDAPGRTMLTSEGSVNRSTHVILDPITNKKRILTPIEAERLNEFPDNWTNTGMPNRRRYFMMGNALVTGIIKSLGEKLSSIIEKE